jgi:hypothetical protein
MGNMLKTIVEICVGLVLLGSLAATAFGALEDYTPTDPTVAAVWVLIPIFAIIGIGYLFLKPFLGGKK